MDPMGVIDYTLNIYICPRKDISPTILFWGWDV